MHPTLRSFAFTRIYKGRGVRIRTTRARPFPSELPPKPRLPKHGALAVKENEVNQKHADQHRTKGTDDGRTRGKVEQHGEVNAESRNQRAHGPTDRQATTDPVREEHRAN